MKTRHGMRLAALLLALGAAACASAQGGKPSLGKAPARTAVVEVANNGFADVTVYVLQSGMRQRLGTVTGLSEQRFSLHISNDAADVYLLADPIGGSRAYLSPPVRVRAGEAVDLRLHATLSMSSVSVWGP